MLLRSLSLAVLLGAAPAAAGDTIQLNGVWDGKVTYLKGTGPLVGHLEGDRALRLEIQGDQVHVFFGSDAARMREVKANEFRIAPYMTNAVIFVSDSGSDREGTWVESWTITVTLKDANTMLADYSRVVNNLALPVTSDHGKFAIQAFGELKRTAQ